ncbi:MAG: alpha/beta hydrolase [Clostridiales bacterium]|jgi:pimeloyl-ACP methyl ester carboxylesterase|nr:alpha/beta hydrolase [Clostridiales bacterium]
MKNSPTRSKNSFSSDILRYFATTVAFREVRLKWKRYVLFAAAAAFFFYAVFAGAMSLYYASAIIHPDASPVAPIKENLGFEYAGVSFRSSDDSVTLRGWLFGPRAARNAVILVHGFGGNRFPFGEDTLKIVAAMGGIGYNVLAFDLRNSGDAARGVSTFGMYEKNDVLGAVAYMKGIGYKNIVLYGVSTGANAAALAASRTPTADVAALVLDSPVAQANSFILHKLRERFPKAPDFPFRRTVPLMAGLFLNGDVGEADIGPALSGFVPRPVLLIHGDNDEIVSKAEMAEVYEGYLAQAVGRASLWNVRGAGHAGAFAAGGEEYLGRVESFILRYIPPPAAAAGVTKQ